MIRDPNGNPPVFLTAVRSLRNTFKGIKSLKVLGTNLPKLTNDPLGCLIQDECGIPINPIEPTTNHHLTNKLRPFHPECIRSTPAKGPVDEYQMLFRTHAAAGD